MHPSSHYNPQRICCFMCLSISLFLSVKAQKINTPTEELSQQIELLSKNNPSELIYIQTSKGIYETLEDLWFKAYILNAQDFSPSLLSQTVHLQLLNEKTKQAYWQEKYEIQKGFAEGHVYIQDSLPEGDYLLAAYTRFSFYNDGSDMKALRKIKIIKEVKENKIQERIPANLQTTNINNDPVQFTVFPEGGNLVSGIQNLLAFKAVGIDGKPIEVQGVLFEDTIPIIEFKSTHAGMGSLNFTPYTWKKYYIKLTEPAIDSIYGLPEVYSEGIVMHLASWNKDTLVFTVTQSPGLNPGTIYLRGQVRGIVYCLTYGLLNEKLIIKVPLKDIPCQGIAEFTLFNDNLVPVTERLVYINPKRRLFIETRLNKERYETREKVTLNITVKDENENPVKTNMGVTVYDKIYQNQADPVNILTHCFLSSQLKGNIYDPAYYFNNNNKDREEALNLLLLTQGWRRYIWSEEVVKETRDKQKPVVFDGVEGEVYVTSKLKRAQGMTQLVKAFNPGMGERSYIIMADSSGTFFVNPIHLKTWQGEYVYLKPMAPEEFEPGIKLTDPFENINDVLKIKEFSYPVPSAKALKEKYPADPYVEGRNTIKLGEVTVKAQGIKAFRDKYMGHLDSLAKFNSTTDYECAVGCSELNCQFHTKDKSHKPVEGKRYRTREGVNLEGGYFLSGGVTFVYHYPKFTEEELLRMNNLSRIVAYYPHREFYQPEYDRVTWVESTSDFRNTLYWGPAVITNEKGEAKVEFFCSDINTGFIGNIEGVSGDGLLGADHFEFFVNKKKMNPSK